MNRHCDSLRELKPALIILIVALLSQLICSCQNTSDDPTFPTLKDYVGTWSFDDDLGSYSLVINSDASCALATKYPGYSTSTTSGSAHVNNDGSAEFVMENTVAYLYANTGGEETVTIGSFTLRRKSGSIGTTIEGTWEYFGLDDSISIAFNGDATISGTQDSYSFTGTWNASTIHAVILAYSMNIDLSANPNTIHLSNTDFDMILARQ
jgi:hypothetical protein